MKRINNILIKSLAVLLLIVVVIAAAGIVASSNSASYDTIEDKSGPETSYAYEILEPETWVGKELPVIDYIDIGEQLKTGNWLVLFYHYDCPDCQKAITELEKIAANLSGNDDFPQIAIIDVPPYGPSLQTSCSIGRLPEVKEWFITTPAMVLLKSGKVAQSWEQELPDFGSILDNISTETREKSLFAERR